MLWKLCVQSVYSREPSYKQLPTRFDCNQTRFTSFVESSVLRPQPDTAIRSERFTVYSALPNKTGHVVVLLSYQGRGHISHARTFTLYFTRVAREPSMGIIFSCTIVNLEPWQFFTAPFFIPRNCSNLFPFLFSFFLLYPLTYRPTLWDKLSAERDERYFYLN